MGGTMRKESVLIKPETNEKNSSPEIFEKKHVIENNNQNTNFEHNLTVQVSRVNLVKRKKNQSFFTIKKDSEVLVYVNIFFCKNNFYLFCQ